MRKSLSTILTVLLLTINAARARADSPSLNTVTFKCADACVTLLAAPDVSFPSPLIEATSRGYDFSSPFASNWTPAKEYVWETGTVSYGSRGTTYDSGVRIPPLALAAFGQGDIADCESKPGPSPVPEPSSGILALTGIGLVILVGNYLGLLPHLRGSPLLK
jgi:hypothetical protein